MRTIVRKRIRLIFRFVLLGLLFGLIVPKAALAIDVYGRIRGYVTDPSGAVIPGATVTVTNTDTGRSNSLTSASDGSFEFVQLPAPSSYDLRCEKEGFKAF